MNSLAWMKFELTYYDIAVKYVNHHFNVNPPQLNYSLCSGMFYTDWNKITKQKKKKKEEKKKWSDVFRKCTARLPKVFLCRSWKFPTEFFPEKDSWIQWRKEIFVYYMFILDAFAG